MGGMGCAMCPRRILFRVFYQLVRGRTINFKGICIIVLPHSPYSHPIALWVEGGIITHLWWGCKQTNARPIDENANRWDVSGGVGESRGHGDNNWQRRRRWVLLVPQSPQPSPPGPLFLPEQYNIRRPESTTLLLSLPTHTTHNNSRPTKYCTLNWRNCRLSSILIRHYLFALYDSMEASSIDRLDSIWEDTRNHNQE